MRCDLRPWIIHEVPAFPREGGPHGVRQDVVERAVIRPDGETFSVDETWLDPETTDSLPPIPIVPTLVNRAREIIESALERRAAVASQVLRGSPKSSGYREQSLSRGPRAWNQQAPIQMCIA